MTAFHLSENIDKNKVFLVNKSRIEKRLDPHYYKPEFQEITNFLVYKSTTYIKKVSTKTFSGIS